MTRAIYLALPLLLGAVGAYGMSMPPVLTYSTLVDSRPNLEQLVLEGTITSEQRDLAQLRLTEGIAIEELCRRAETLLKQLDYMNPLYPWTLLMYVKLLADNGRSRECVFAAHQFLRESHLFEWSAARPTGTPNLDAYTVGFLVNAYAHVENEDFSPTPMERVLAVNDLLILLAAQPEDDLDILRARIYCADTLELGIENLPADDSEHAERLDIFGRERRLKTYDSVATALQAVVEESQQVQNTEPIRSHAVYSAGQFLEEVEQSAERQRQQLKLKKNPFIR